MAIDGIALRTLRRGTAFVRGESVQGTLGGPWPTGMAGAVRARFMGNCLAELDRFLHVLMDEIAPAMGAQPMPRQHNAANKIGDLVAARWDTGADRARLRALGRSRACLSRCHGLVRRPDAAGLGWMTAGWPAPGTPALQRYRLGDRMAPAGAELADVGLFYDALADRLSAAVR